jgi:hypothetical protein
MRGIGCSRRCASTHTRLTEAGETHPVRERHACYYLLLAEEVGPSMYEWAAAAVDRLLTKHDNLRAAARWFSESNAVERAVRLGGQLWGIWVFAGYLTEGEAQLRSLLALPSTACAPRDWARLAVLLFSISTADLGRPLAAPLWSGFYPVRDQSGNGRGESGQDSRIRLGSTFGVGTWVYWGEPMIDLQEYLDAGFTQPQAALLIARDRRTEDRFEMLHASLTRGFANVLSTMQALTNQTVNGFTAMGARMDRIEQRLGRVEDALHGPGRN